MMGFHQARAALIGRILDGTGRASREQRRHAFDLVEAGGPLGNLLRKVAAQARDVDDEDIAAAKASGLNEDQIFELVVCAAIGEATRRCDAALAALDAAVAKKE